LLHIKPTTLSEMIKRHGIGPWHKKHKSIGTVEAGVARRQAHPPAQLPPE